MRCSKTFELLSRKLDRQLSYREREALRQHLSGCPACRELQAKMESDSLDLKRNLHFAKPDLRHFVTKTMAYITEMEEPHTPASVHASRSAQRSRTAWVLAQSIGLAASIAVIAYLSFIQGPNLSDQIAKLEVELGDTRVDLEEALQVARSERTTTEIDSREQIPIVSDTTAHASDAANDPAAITEPDGIGDETTTEGLPLAVATISQVATQSAETLVSDLLLAIEGNDTSEIQRLSGVLFDLREKTEMVADLLAASYREEPDAAKRSQLLDVMSEFATESQQSFYLDELEHETDVPLRRTLTEGMARLLVDGQYPVAGASEHLRRLLNDPKEDFQVRALAAEALLGESLSSENYDLFQEISSQVLTAEDARFREKVVASIAKNVPGTNNLLADDISEFLVEYVSNERDYSASASVYTGLESAANPREALQILQRMKRRPDLERRWKRAREVLEGEGDRTIVGEK